MLHKTVVFDIFLMNLPIRSTFELLVLVKIFVHIVIITFLKISEIIIWLTMLHPPNRVSNLKGSFYSWILYNHGRSISVKLPEVWALYSFTLPLTTFVDRHYTVKFFVISRIFIHLSRESDQSVITSSLRSCCPSVYHSNPTKCLSERLNK